jgi:hypothetical protein
MAALFAEGDSAGIPELLALPDEEHGSATLTPLLLFDAVDRRHLLDLFAYSEWVVAGPLERPRGPHALSRPRRRGWRDGRILAKFSPICPELGLEKIRVEEEKMPALWDGVAVDASATRIHRRSVSRLPNIRRGKTEVTQVKRGTRARVAVRRLEHL